MTLKTSPLVRCGLIATALFLSNIVFSQNAFAQTKSRPKWKETSESQKIADKTEVDETSQAVEADDDDSYESPRRSQTGATKFFNARIAPIGLLIRYINVDLDFKISDNWTIGPTVSYWSYNFDSSLYTGSSLKVESLIFGARATWAKNGAFESGLYISPIIQYQTAKVSGTSASTGRTVTASGNQPLISGLIGYQWFRDSFNLNVGAGLSVGAASNKIEATDGTNTTSVETTRGGALALDFMIGYAF